MQHLNKLFTLKSLQLQIGFPGFHPQIHHLFHQLGSLSRVAEMTFQNLNVANRLLIVVIVCNTCVAARFRLGGFLR